MNTRIHLRKIDGAPDNSDADGEILFSLSQARTIAEQLKALAHPVRLQILQYLGDRENCCCNDFCASIPLAQSTISQHLKILNKAGIIDYQPAGNCSNYSLNPGALAQAINALSSLQQLAEGSSSEKMPTHHMKKLKGR